MTDMDIRSSTATGHCTDESRSRRWWVVRNVVRIGTIEQSTKNYADSNIRLTRHSSDSTAFEAPVNSSQHGISAAGQLVIRFWAVTS